MLSQEQQIFEQIKKAKDVLITFSRTRNGDAIASSLALYLFLKKLGKNVEIVADKPEAKHIHMQNKNASFSFLPAFEAIKETLNNLRQFIITLNITNAKVGQIRYKMTSDKLNFIISPKDGFFTPNDITAKPGEFKYDLIITVDTPDLESLGSTYDHDTEFFYKTPVINIDHRPSNENYGQINFVELNAVSSSEVLFSLFESYDRKMIDEEIATCLLAGIIYKTKNFKTHNITPHTLLTTSQLISMGARREEIVNLLYRSRSLNVLKLWGRILARLTNDMDGKLIWSTLSKVDFETTNSTEEDLGDIIDELIVNIPQAKIIVLIFERSKNNDNNQNDESNIVVYSKTNINSLELIEKYKPVGTKGFAQAITKVPVQKAEKEVIESIKDKLSKLPL